MYRAFLLIVPLLITFSVSCTSAPEKKQDDLASVVEQMNGISMQLSGIGRSNGEPNPVELKKKEILDRLAASGEKSIPPLVKALSDNDVQMRRNACLVLIQLANPLGSDRPKINIETALPDLIKATKDSDADVRAWAAHAIGEMGPGASDALPDLIRLLKDEDEAPRNTATMALSVIETEAALPALKEALKDENENVRSYAEAAISRINQKEKD